MGNERFGEAPPEAASGAELCRSLKKGTDGTLIERLECVDMSCILLGTLLLSTIPVRLRSRPISARLPATVHKGRHRPKISRVAQCGYSTLRSIHKFVFFLVALFVPYQTGHLGFRGICFLN